MATFPEPPPKAQLQAIGPDIAILHAGTGLWRIYFRGGPHPTTWDQFRKYGPTNARFDHHTTPTRIQKRSVTYLAENGPTCLAEVYQDTRTIDRGRDNPWLVRFETVRDVSLLDLTNLWPTKAGASMAINSGSRAKARKWSRAIYTAYANVEGLLYCSSMHGNRPAVTLYDRAISTMPATPTFNRALLDPSMTTILSNTAVKLNYILI
jgi:hypothetical protein